MIQVKSLCEIPLPLLETNHRNYMPLMRSGIKNIAQLCWMREKDLLRLQGMGPVRVSRVKEALGKLGLALRQ